MCSCSEPEVNQGGPAKNQICCKMLVRISLEKRLLEAEEMAPQIKCLPLKHEVLSLVPRSPPKVLNVVVQAHNLRAGEVQAGDTSVSLVY